MTKAKIDSCDRLLLYGYGLFETMLVTGKGPLFMRLHWQRMHEGARSLGLSLVSYTEWQDMVLAFAQEQPLNPPYALRITLSGGDPIHNFPPQLIMHTRPFPYSPTQYNEGMKLALLSWPRNEYSPLAKIKSTNYLENLWAKDEALKAGANEGLWLNTKGHLCEGTMSNFFFIRNKELYTPSLSSGCLPGTRRAIILSLARQLQTPVYEGEYFPEDLWQAEEVFLTNALMGIMPVKEVAGHPFGVAQLRDTSSLTRRLSGALSNLAWD